MAVWDPNNVEEPNGNDVFPSVSSDGGVVNVEVPVPDPDGGAQSFFAGLFVLVVIFAWFVRGGQSVFGTLGHWSGQAFLVAGFTLLAVVFYNVA